MTTRWNRIRSRQRKFYGTAAALIALEWIAMWINSFLLGSGVTFKVLFVAMVVTCIVAALLPGWITRCPDCRTNLMKGIKFADLLKLQKCPKCGVDLHEETEG